MKFILRSVLNAVASFALSMFTLNVLGALTPMSIDTNSYDSIFGAISHFIISVIKYSPLLEFALLYLINSMLNKIEFLRLPTLKSVWSISVGALLVCLFYSYREWLDGGIGGSYILIKILNFIINYYFLIKFIGISILSLIAAPILANLNKKKV